MAEQPTSTRAFYSARPTVRVDGQAYATVSQLLLGMEMTEREGGLSALELRLTNLASDGAGGAAFAFEDDAVLRLGAAVTVHAGEESAPREIFRGVVTGLEAEYPDDGPPTLVVLAEDAFQRARMQRRTRLLEDATAADVARDLAARLGLTPVVTGLDEQLGPQVQLNESDLAFLRRLLARQDADVQVVGGELHVSPRDDVRRGALELALHSQLRRARVLADLAGQVTEVSVGGWDVAQAERVAESSAGPAPAPGSGRTGADVLRDALGARARHVGHLAVRSAAEARAVARAAFEGAARRFCTVEGTAEGNAALRVGTHVRLTGLGGRFTNTYYVTLARHRYDLARGYETDFEAECSYVGRGNA